MSGRSNIPSTWVRLDLAPFLLRHGTEPSDEDVQRDIDLEHWFVTEPGFACTPWIDWQKGSVGVSVPWAGTLVPFPEDGDDDAAGDPSVEAHPLRFRDAVRGVVRPEYANTLADIAGSLWNRLVGHFGRLVAEEVLVVHARGGPRPPADHGFKRVPPDIWASSSVDWAAGTCTTPDGQIYFSIHVCHPEAAKAAPVERRARELRLEPTAPPSAFDAIEPNKAIDFDDQDLCDVKEVARLTRISTSSLNKWRDQQKGPPYFKLENGRVRYSKKAALAWATRSKRNDFAVRPEP